MSARVSLCVIAKNEEANLRPCLEPVAKLVDEIVLVDTGSSDHTKEVAAALGARVFDFPWVDDFAAARNETLTHASSPWIFWMDADDRVDEANRQRLQALFASLGDENAAFIMKCQGMTSTGAPTGSDTDHVRLFCNLPGARRQYPVHEQILPALCRLGAEVRKTDIVIHHIGYDDKATFVRKGERNLRLLERLLAEHPGDPHALFYLAQTHLGLGAFMRALPFLVECLKVYDARSLMTPPLYNLLLQALRQADESQDGSAMGQALPFFRECVALADPRNPMTPRAYVLLLQALLRAGQNAQAAAICQAGRQLFPTNPELLFFEGMARQTAGDQAGGETCFKQLLEIPPASRINMLDPSMTQKARHQLALGYLRQRRLDEAETQWRAIVSETPACTEAWLGLADVCQVRGHLRSWDELIQSAASVADNDLNATLLAARFRQAQNDHASARLLLENACIRYAHAIWPRLALARILLQEGRDLSAAERALQAVLALEPNHREAQRNLTLLQGKPNMTG
jgi:tetratricopeptide (TPR) repeat protein